MDIELSERKRALITWARILDKKARSLTQDKGDWENGFKELKQEIVSPSVLFCAFLVHLPNRPNVYTELPF